MGGSTLSNIGDTREEVIEEAKREIIAAARRGLWPDTELVVLQEGAKRAELYRVELVEDLPEEKPPLYEVQLTEVQSGVAWHIVVAARFERAMKTGEWLATIHVHT